MNVASIRFSLTVLIRKGSGGLKACKNLLVVQMRFYMKFEIDTRGNVSMMPGCTDRQTLASLYMKICLTPRCLRRGIGKGPDAGGGGGMRRGGRGAGGRESYT